MARFCLFDIDVPPEPRPRGPAFLPAPSHRAALLPPAAARPGHHVGRSAGLLLDGHRPPDADGPAQPLALDALHATARPDDLDRLDVFGRAEAEVERAHRLGGVTAAGLDVARHGLAARRQPDAC